MKVIPEKWVRLPEYGDPGRLLVTLVGGEEEIPLLVEAENVPVKSVTLGTEQEFEIWLEDADEIKLYKDERDYYAGRTSSFAAESLIPCGTFPAGEDPGFVPSDTAIVQGRVTEICQDPVSLGFADGELPFVIQCLGYEFGVFARNANEYLKSIAVDNIISGLFWVFGWPKEDE